MKLSRRNFINLSSFALAGVPFLKLSASPSFYNAPGKTEDQLFHLFQNPENINKPFIRWWWNGIRVVKEELLRELDLLKAAGIGGVEINAIEFPETADPMNYEEHQWLSDYWIDMLMAAVKGAKERGMICDIIVGSGWPFGAEFLKEAEQTQMITIVTRELEGPAKFSIPRKELLDEAEPPFSSKRKEKRKDLFALRLAPAYLEKFAPGIDLNSEIQNDTIAFSVPQGKFILYALVKLTGYMQVLHGAPGAMGPVLNHYNKSAVEAYLNRMSDAITSRMGSMKDHFRSLFVDSFELEGANWCSDMAEQFEKRRGYKLEPYFPFILFKTGRMGRPLNEKYGAQFSDKVQEIINRVRYDFEITKMELFQERFTDTYLAWCKKNGVKSRVQAYGREFNPLDVSMQIDIPEGETWIRTHAGEDFKEDDPTYGRTYSEVNKFVSSGAHLSGKSLISCEDITNTQMVFNATLDRMKVTSDQSALIGITHSIFHGFNYSPPEAEFPGWVRYGTFFNERNPWWPFLPRFTAYKSRLYSVFQNSEMFADVAVMHATPDLWSKNFAPWDPFPEVAHPWYAHMVWEAIHQNGSACDYLSEKVLQASRFSKSTISYGNRKYKALLLLEMESMQVETAIALLEYAKAGGKIICIGKEPKQSAGLYRHEERDERVAQIVGEIKQNYSNNFHLFPAPEKEQRKVDWYKELQTKYHIEPYLKIAGPSPWVNQIYYKQGDLDIFFFSNYNLKRSFNSSVSFDAKDKSAWLWDTETGNRYLYPVKGKKGNFDLSLDPGESKLIVFSRQNKGETYHPVLFNESAGSVISGTWKVSLEHVNGTRENITLENLIDFKDHEKLKSFAGVACYENVFRIVKNEKNHLVDLGKVSGISVLYINDQEVGSKWFGKHVYDISKAVKEGENSMKVKITTTLGNYMKSLNDNKTAVKWMKSQPLYSSGLIGPVKLI
jgi:hypothetical protein